MKIKKQLGSDAVRGLIEAARARAKELPDRSVRDPGPPSRSVISDVLEPDTDDSHQKDQ